MHALFLQQLQILLNLIFVCCLLSSSSFFHHLSGSNSIGNIGVTALAESLIACPSLASLDLFGILLYQFKECFIFARQWNHLWWSEISFKSTFKHMHGAYTFKYWVQFYWKWRSYFNFWSFERKQDNEKTLSLGYFFPPSNEPNAKFITGNEITYDGAKAIASSITESKSLLDFSFGFFFFLFTPSFLYPGMATDDSVTGLSSSFVDNTTLTHLNIWGFFSFSFQ